MAEDLKDWRLDNISVVLLAQSHNPSIVNPDFLAANELVRKSEKPTTPPTTTAIFAEVQYEKLKWQVDPNRCSIREEIDGAEFMGDYEAPYCAKRYARVLEHIRYTALGLNWQIRATLARDARGWIIEKFLTKSALTRELESVRLAFKLRAELAQCLLTVDVTGSDSILVDSNFHFTLDNEGKIVDTIMIVLDDWNSYQSILIDYLQRYIFDQSLARSA